VPTSNKGISDFYDLSFFFYPSVTLDRPVLYLTTVHK
jgi:CRISPR/Cas system CMR subunit Cmr4 (Cas7 group RAMP superfamily)